MPESKMREDFQTTEEIFSSQSEEVQAVVKETLKLARLTATGTGSITKDDVVEIIRSAVK